MAVFEGSHGNILQGVSQQIPRSRLEGQVSEQINMVSDPVTGIRRRQGCKIKDTILNSTATVATLKAWRTEVAGSKVEFMLDTSTGSLRVDDRGTKTTLQSDYLKTPNADVIKYTTVGESLYLVNKTKVPTGKAVEYRSWDKVGYSAFADFKSGALSREFKLSLRITPKGHPSQEAEASYVTPNGSQPHEISLITPEYIAMKLFNDLNAKIPELGLGGLVYLYYHNAVIVVKGVDDTKVRLLANAGEMYVITSNVGNLKDAGLLPDRMPDLTDGVRYSVGKSSNLTYYKYDEANGVWVETSSTEGYVELENMPVEVYFDVDQDAWVINEEPFPARLAGDEENNPDPDFVDWGITGISSYQGRLVLLSGSYVWMSASSKPRLFYRTTVEDLIDTDPIGIGSSSATSASFQYAINFNKDLILFSAEHQALIAGSNTAITPKNANIMLTSTYTADMSVEPVSLGRSVMYPMPRSLSSYGMMEMVPSPYTDSAYISTDVTEHIPSYLKGRCRLAVSSTVGSIALFGSTTCLRTLFVHEYVWEGDEKLLRAWHRWEFSKDLADIYFDGDLITLAFIDNGSIVLTTIDPRSQVTDQNMFLDFNAVYPVTDKEVKLLEEYAKFLGDIEVKAVHSDGGLAGSLVGTTRESEDTLKLTTSTEASSVLVGVSYRSELQPSPPIVRDQDGLPVATNRLNLINYFCTTDNSGTYTVTIKDKARASLDIEYDKNPVQWLSTELNLGRTPLGGLSGDVIPCRVPSDSSVVTFSTDGVNEFNVIALEYVCKYNYRRQRR